MTLIYVIATLALVFMAYLARDFYNEQLRERMIPLRSAVRKHLARRLRRG
jgi:hypothetical protein